MFKKILMFVIAAFIFADSSFGQQQRQEDCVSDLRKNAGPGVDRVLLQQRINELGRNASLPYTMRIQVIVFYTTTPTVTDTKILRNITEMAGYYRPHNICFVLSDIEYVQDADMADFSVAEENKLLPYTRPYYISIFIHENLPGLYGTAYAIPNTYMSMVDDAIFNVANRSVLAHEMGHCMALYHTFETYLGTEHPARTGSCKNCETDGDLLCDTQADRQILPSLIDALCNYTGKDSSSCSTSANVPLVMETKNIMSYGRDLCHDHFSAGQGGRMRDFILTETMLYNCIAPGVITIAQTNNSTGGSYSVTSKELINVTSPSYNISGSAKMRMTSRKIRIGPGSSFKPTVAGGLVRLLPNPNCQ